MQGAGGIGGGSSLSMTALMKKTMDLQRAETQAAGGSLAAAKERLKLEGEIRTGKVECQTCSSRQYVDGSNDPSVSFKTPQNISPGNSLSTVLSHEYEHVSNERADAQRENRQILRNSVSIQYATCPECGTRYVSGGKTTTVTKGESKASPLPQELEKGRNIDMRV